MNQPLSQKAVSELREFAHDIGYEWAMVLGASETDWHKIVDVLAERAPLRAVHNYARTELVWLHARNLHDFPIFCLSGGRKTVSTTEIFLKLKPPRTGRAKSVGGPRPCAQK